MICSYYEPPPPNRIEVNKKKKMNEFYVAKEGLCKADKWVNRHPISTVYERAVKMPTPSFSLLNLNVTHKLHSRVFQGCKLRKPELFNSIQIFSFFFSLGNWKCWDLWLQFIVAALIHGRFMGDSSGRFTHAEPPFEIHFSINGKQELTKQFSTQGLDNTLREG